VAGHPEVVPCEHADRSRKDRGVQDFLPGSLKRVGDGGGEDGYDPRAARAGRDTRGYPLRAAPDANGSRHDDADDERGFQHIAEDDDRDGEHGTSARDETTANRRMEVVEEPVNPWP
jgi:hypothetical protein